MVEQVCISGFPHLLGDPSFNNESFHSLKVGDKISRIGDGRNSSTHRTLEITPYMTYSGSYIANDGKKYFCFKLPENGVSGWNLFRQKTDVYACLVDLDVLIGRQNHNIQTVFCYVPQFKIEP